MGRIHVHRTTHSPQIRTDDIASERTDSIVAESVNGVGEGKDAIDARTQWCSAIAAFIVSNMSRRRNRDAVMRNSNEDEDRC